MVMGKTYGWLDANLVEQLGRFRQWRSQHDNFLYTFLRTVCLIFEVSTIGSV